jgi:hypothetical protein
VLIALAGCLLLSQPVFVAALALSAQFTAAEAATTCKDAAKMDFPNDRKSRRACKKECKAAWKASHG